MQAATNLNRLAYFVAVVDAGSFTRAAEYLGITKAVVSQQVARLEKEVGTTLLMRTRHDGCSRPRRGECSMRDACQFCARPRMPLVNWLRPGPTPKACSGLRHHMTTAPRSAPHINRS